MLIVIAVLLAILAVEAWYLARGLSAQADALIAATEAHAAILRDRIPEAHSLVSVSDVLKNGEGRALLRARLAERLSKREGN